MLFSSMTFLTLFLPLVLVGYFILALFFREGFGPSRRWLPLNLFLVVVSLLFYSWGEGSLVWVLIGVCLGNFYLARLMLWGERDGEGFQSGRARSLYRRGILIVGLSLNLGVLAYFKYANFFVEHLAGALPSQGSGAKWVQVALPLGISFFIFQALSYIIDVYRGDVRPAKRLIDFSCFLTLFPQLVAGPIVRYHDVARQLSERILSRAQFASGVRRFIIGLSKKVLIANTMAVIADQAFGVSSSKLTAATAWLGIVCYTLQIYYDFSGYSDMAIGLGRMLGFEFLENFNYPYSASSMRDFWRRWHISLSTWFRDYLYRPLGGGRKGVGRTYLNLCIVFFLCGLWHGANGMFVIWGLFHGFFLIAERLCGVDPAKGFLSGRKGWRWNHLYVLAVAMAGWVLFRSSNLEQAWGYFAALLGRGQGSGEANVIRWLYFSWDVKIAMALGILFSFPILPGLKKKWEERVALHRNDFSLKQRGLVFAAELGQVMCLLGLLLLCFLPLASGTYNPFIYFHF